MLPTDCGANYFEVFVTSNTSSKHGDADIYEIGLSKEEFNNLLAKIGKAEGLKHFQKEYKEYVYNEAVVHNYMNTETRVFKNTPVLVQEGTKCVLVAYNRSKLTFLNVPSTKTIHDTQCVKKLIFRVNNRIFVNFQAASPPEGKENDVTYTVYLNYNHEQNVEMDSIRGALDKISDLLGISF
jgi:hypothetical protein